MSIGRHSFWSMTDDSESLPEKALGGLHIPFLTQARIHQVAITINRSIVYNFTSSSPQ